MDFFSSKVGLDSPSASPHGSARRRRTMTMRNLPSPLVNRRRLFTSRPESMMVNEVPPVSALPPRITAPPSPPPSSHGIPPPIAKAELPVLSLAAEVPPPLKIRRLSVQDRPRAPAPPPLTPRETNLAELPPPISASQPNVRNTPIQSLKQAAASAPLSPSKLGTVKERNLGRSRKELYTSEYKYWQTLDDLCGNYRRVLLEEYSLSESSADQIFGNIEELRELSHSMCKGLQSWQGGETNLLDLFLSVGSALSHAAIRYADHYHNNFLHICKELDGKQIGNVKAENKEMVKIFQHFTREKKKCVQELSSGLITPIQRIPRYQLLVKNILEFCESKEDREEAEKAFAIAREISISMNKTLAILQNTQSCREKVEEFIKEFENGEEVALQLECAENPGVPVRTDVLEVATKKLVSESEKTGAIEGVRHLSLELTPRKLILFGSRLVIASQAKRSNKLEVEAVLEVELLFVKRVVDDEAALSVCTPYPQEHVLRFSSPSDANEWHEVINQLVEKLCAQSTKVRNNRMRAAGNMGKVTVMCESGERLIYYCFQEATEKLEPVKVLVQSSTATATPRKQSKQHQIGENAINGSEETVDLTLSSFYSQLRQIEQAGGCSKQTKRNVSMMQQLILNRKKMIQVPLTPEEEQWEEQLRAENGDNQENNMQQAGMVTPKRKRTGGIFGTPLRTPKSAKRMRRSISNMAGSRSLISPRADRTDRADR